MTDPAPESAPAAEPKREPTAKDSWLLSIGWGLLVLFALAGLALAFRWENLSRALDVRALFR